MLDLDLDLKTRGFGLGLGLGFAGLVTSLNLRSGDKTNETGLKLGN